jgi:hypothetical protein
LYTDCLWEYWLHKYVQIIYYYYYYIHVIICKDEKIKRILADASATKRTRKYTTILLVGFTLLCLITMWWWHYIFWRVWPRPRRNEWDPAAVTKLLPPRCTVTCYYYIIICIRLAYIWRYLGIMYTLCKGSCYIAGLHDVIIFTSLSCGRDNRVAGERISFIFFIFYYLYFMGFLEKKKVWNAYSFFTALDHDEFLVYS